MKPTKNCHCCDGSGKELDNEAVGLEMRNMRISRKLSLAKVGAKIGLSVPYLSDLERGRRNWNDRLIKTYKESMK